jgi:hypothetical protein
MSAPRPIVSVGIVARDEAHSIEACLRSVAWTDERIALDSGSTDDATVAIVRDLGARDECTDWPGYGTQRNRAISRCPGDWVLSLDPDEEVSRQSACRWSAPSQGPRNARETDAMHDPFGRLPDCPAIRDRICVKTPPMPSFTH